MQWRAFCDIFGAVARLGVRRQVAELREALRRVYLAASVLVEDPELPGDWGVAILEGGAFLDEFSKAFLLDWTASNISYDAVVQHMRLARSEPAHIQIVFEEANKILSGVDAGEEEGGPRPPRSSSRP